ncbi:MAG: DUF4233 domain-containing protein [Nakamurella sp.]
MTSAAQQPATDPPPVADLERGLRGVMSAILILEAIAILLGLTVIANGGTDARAWQIIVVVLIALAHILAPIVIKKPYAIVLIFVLQALLTASWVIHPSIGITGIVFIVVWVLIVIMRSEFRRRVAAGTMH